MVERFKTNTPAIIRLDQTGEEVPVTIHNMSVTGAGLTLHVVPRINAPVTLKMSWGSERIEVAAIVRWAEPADGGGWRAGCQFDRKLDLGLKGRVDRTACDIPVLFRRQGEQELNAAVIRNHSSVGLRLTTSVALNAKDRLRVEAGDAVFTVRVAWANASEDGWTAGCCFWPSTERANFGKMPGVIQSKSALLPADTLDNATRGLRAACLLVYGWIALYLTGAWPI